MATISQRQNIQNTWGRVLGQSYKLGAEPLIHYIYVLVNINKLNKFKQVYCTFMSCTKTEER